MSNTSTDSSARPLFIPRTSRPRLFQSSPSDPDQQRLRDLRLLLNKLTPSNGEEQTNLLLAFSFSEPLINNFIAIATAKASAQKVLSPALAQMCMRLECFLQLQVVNLCSYFQEKLRFVLQESVKAALRTEIEKVVGLLSFEAWLTIEGSYPIEELFVSFREVLGAELPTEDGVVAVCSVFKATVGPIILLKEDARGLSEELIERLELRLERQECSKKLQFQVEDILTSKFELLHPTPKAIILNSPPLIRKKGSKSKKRVRFPDIVAAEPTPESPSSTEPENEDQRRSAHTRVSPMSIIKTQLRLEHKV